MGHNYFQYEYYLLSCKKIYYKYLEIHYIQTKYVNFKRNYKENDIPGKIHRDYLQNFHYMSHYFYFQTCFLFFFFLFSFFLDNRLNIICLEICGLYYKDLLDLPSISFFFLISFEICEMNFRYIRIFCLSGVLNVKNSLLFV